MHREVNVLALVKGDERYVYIYDEESHPLLLVTLAEHSRNSDLALTGFDAAVLAERSLEQLNSEEAPTA